MLYLTCDETDIICVTNCYTVFFKSEIKLVRTFYNEKKNFVCILFQSIELYGLQNRKHYLCDRIHLVEIHNCKL